MINKIVTSGVVVGLCMLLYVAGLKYYRCVWVTNDLDSAAFIGLLIVAIFILIWICAKMVKERME